MDAATALVLPILMLFLLLLATFLLTIFLHRRQRRIWKAAQAQLRPLSLGRINDHQLGTFAPKVKSPLASIHIMPHNNRIDNRAREGTLLSPRQTAQRPLSLMPCLPTPARLPLRVNVPSGSVAALCHTSDPSPEEQVAEKPKIPSLNFDANKPLPALRAVDVGSPRMESFEAFIADTLQRRNEREEKERNNPVLLSSHPGPSFPDGAALTLVAATFEEIDLGRVSSERQISHSKLVGKLPE